METLRVYLQHTNVNKQLQKQPQTAAAHARYIMRKEAAEFIYSERMPKQYHAVQRFLNEHEEGLRKNGRVIDKFIISIPRDVSLEHAAECLRHFGFQLGQGKTPFLFAIHGFDTNNHHAHFIFIDRDVETGRRVFGTSEKGSTHGIKIQWQDGTNRLLEQLGYNVRIEVHEGIQPELYAENDNQLSGEIVQLNEDQIQTAEAAGLQPDLSVGSNELVSDGLPTALDDTNVVQLEQAAELQSDNPDLTPEAEDAREGDDEMVGPEEVGSVEYPHDRTVSAAANAARTLHRVVLELSRISDAQTRIAEAGQRYEALSLRVQAQEKRAADHFAESSHVLQHADASQRYLQTLQTEGGKLKGFALRIPRIKLGPLSVGGIEFRSATRKQAEAAMAQAEVATVLAHEAELERKAQADATQQTERMRQDAKREAERGRAYLESTYGPEEAVERTRRQHEAKRIAIVQEPDLANRKNLTSVTTEEVQEAFEAMEITPEVYRAFLEQRGDEERLAQLDDWSEDETYSESL